MKLPIELTTVTPLSKAVALIMFISLPIIAFLFGMQYQILLSEQNSSIPSVVVPSSAPIACTMDAKTCPDGSSVGRTGPNCEFEACPTAQIDGTFCGGFAGKACPSGYYCKYDGAYPDAGGTCLKNR